MNERRFDQISSQSKANNILNTRVDIIEQGIFGLVEQQEALNHLAKLLQSVPSIKKAESSVKNLQNQINEAYRLFQNVEATCEQNQNTNMVNSLQRNFRSINSSLSQLKGSINESEIILQQIRTTKDNQIKEESSLVLKAVSTKLEKNKKDIIKMLQEFDNDPANHRFDQQYQRIKGQRIKQYVNNAKTRYSGQIQKLYFQMGGIRSELQFMKDKNRKQLIIREIGRYPNIIQQEDQRYLLGVIEENVYLNELVQFQNEKSKELLIDLKTIESRLTTIIAYLQKNKNLKEEEKSHFNKQIAYLNDRWFSIKNKIDGIKRKYVIQMKKLEDKLVDLRMLNTQRQTKDLAFKEIEMQLNTATTKISQLNIKNANQLKSSQEIENQITKLKKRLENII